MMTKFCLLKEVITRYLYQFVNPTHLFKYMFVIDYIFGIKNINILFVYILFESVYKFNQVTLISK